MTTVADKIPSSTVITANIIFFYTVVHIQAVETIRNKTYSNIMHYRILTVLHTANSSGER